MTRSRILNKFRQERTTSSYVVCKKQRNICTKLLRKTKKGFFNNIDVKRLTDNKQFWKIVNPCLTDNTLKDARLTLIENEKVISDYSQKKKSSSEITAVLLWTAQYVDVLKTAQSTGDRISKNGDLWQWFFSSRWLWCCYGNNSCRYVRERHRNVIRGKFCCRKPTISKELWTTSLSQLLHDLRIRIRIVETCKIKTSRELVQWRIQQIKIQLRSFFAKVIH